eukprot:s2272_g4.t1
MAWRPKEAIVLVIDVGKSMQETFAAANDGSKVTRAQTALGVAQRLVQHRLFFAPKEEVGLVFFGAQETNNDLQDLGAGQRTLFHPRQQQYLVHIGVGRRRWLSLRRGAHFDVARATFSSTLRVSDRSGCDVVLILMLLAQPSRRLCTCQIALAVAWCLF